MQCFQPTRHSSIIKKLEEQKTLNAILLKSIDIKIEKQKRILDSKKEYLNLVLTSVNSLRQKYVSLTKNHMDKAYSVSEDIKLKRISKEDAAGLLTEMKKEVNEIQTECYYTPAILDGFRIGEVSNIKQIDENLRDAIHSLLSLNTSIIEKLDATISAVTNDSANNPQHFSDLFTLYQGILTKFPNFTQLINSVRQAIGDEQESFSKETAKMKDHANDDFLSQSKIKKSLPRTKKSPRS